MAKRASKPSLASVTINEAEKQAPLTHEQSTVQQQREHATLMHASPFANAEYYPYLAALVANTPDIMIALDESFHILDFNAAAANALGWTPADAIGRNCSQILKCCNLNKMRLCGTSVVLLYVSFKEQLQPLSNEELIIGDTCEVSTSVTSVPTQDGSYIFFTARDMTVLKVANQVRANFVSMVSHELRTPLNWSMAS